MIDLTEDSPAPTPTPKPSAPWLLIAVVVICSYLYFSKQQPSPFPPQPDDQTIVVDDDKTRPSPQPSIDLKDSTLVFVLEATAPTAEQTEVMLSVTTQSLQARGMKGFRRYDEEQPEVQELIELAVSKNTPSPFIAILKDKSVMRLATFPKTPAELEAFLR